MAWRAVKGAGFGPTCLRLGPSGVDNMKDSSTRGTPKAFVSPAKIGRAGFPSG
jgi:hypothetical protein